MDHTMIESLNAIKKHINGDNSEVRIDHVIVDDAPEFDADDIKQIRARIPATQRVMAHMLSVSPRTVESWEAGRSKPNGSSRRLLQLIQSDPEIAKKIETM
ncbi:helix-turn-helix domain-containing protein [Lentilactobacillus kisonensis]|uniref:Toxin-antitoxin system, antitoxin component, Xre family n=2 Tax=Lentilactobacillus kisonensis TaxID=481722 RepID=H1LHC0_9LACO|nr:transcriptional regulator [Lentilactobacillus kisonensis]EHO50472.1 toxin-antitoxin system, antitoxin component, Xre family [Lentilactobacillus kisonensis F0435]KRL20275.1 toxin-antitoxin system, antitoxin component, Xre family [Lentilactobacillus kisonensis DSM 19906 = JCM 15041]